MAFKADCGVSTVLEALCVASTAGFLVPGGCWAVATRGPRDEALRNSAAPTVTSRCKSGVDGKSEIPDSTGVGGGNSEFRIPNSNATSRGPREEALRSAGAPIGGFETAPFDV